MTVNFQNLITIDEEEFSKLFNCQCENNNLKINIRGYSIPFKGTQQNNRNLMVFLRRNLLKYVFPEQQRPEDIDWALARDKFGNISPATDGKLGEMLLYVFVEAILKAPLMAYKLKDLQNPNDQVKGADGVFIGEYRGQRALFIGESKIHKDIKEAISDAFESLQRFHDKKSPYDTELNIAKNYPAQRNLSEEEIKEILQIFDEEMDYVLGHPIFISYDFEEISKISLKALSQEEAEQRLKETILEEIKVWQSNIENQKKYYPKPFQVYLDFFFLPSENSLKLRNDFYCMLHNVDYQEEQKRQEKKINKKVNDILKKKTNEENDNELI